MLCISTTNHLYFSEYFEFIDSSIATTIKWFTSILASLVFETSNILHSDHPKWLFVGVQEIEWLYCPASKCEIKLIHQIGNVKVKYYSGSAVSCSLDLSFRFIYQLRKFSMSLNWIKLRNSLAVKKNWK